MPALANSLTGLDAATWAEPRVPLDWLYGVFVKLAIHDCLGVVVGNLAEVADTGRRIGLAQRDKL